MAKGFSSLKPGEVHNKKLELSLSLSMSQLGLMVCFAIESHAEWINL